MPTSVIFGKITPYSSRGGHKLQNEWCYIKIRQVLSLEMRKNVKKTSNACISETRQDIKISSTYLESAVNFTSDRCSFVIL